MKSTPSTRVIRTIGEMKAFAEAAAGKKKIGLIPTMGGLHDGHLSLVKAAKRFKKRCDTIVVSIFVNPTQFGPREDLEEYPRDLEEDLKKLEKLGVAVVFAPEAAEMFPPGCRTYVDVDALSRRLCGRSRPGHFRGVATVVMKLFNIVKPQLAFFGEKDYQQVLVIRKMVKDLNLDVEIEQRPTVRDKDGLALSTRNSHLKPEQRPAALSLQRAFEVARQLIISGERNSSILISNMREVIRAQSGAEAEYIAVCHPETLADLEAVEARTLIALAVRIDDVRLIDNLFVDLVGMERQERARKDAGGKKAESKRKKT